MEESIVARQPILNRDKKTIAYELLYRTNDNKLIEDGSQATAEVIINSFNDIGINNLTAGKPAFINFTAELIKAEISDILPKKKVGIEILENIELDQDLIDCSHKIKESGQILLLDDFVYKKELIPLIEIADIIKIDFLDTQGKKRKEIIDLIRKKHNPDVKFLAEKIENYQEFQTAYDYGYDYFQGFFFKKPNTFANRKLPSYKFTYLEVIEKLNKNDPDIKEISRIIKKDSAMTYSLLRTICSAAYGYQISNLEQAAALLGAKKLKKWALLSFIKGLSSTKPDALFINSLLRAKLAELIAVEICAESPEEFYTAGILSMLDAYLDRNMNEIIADLPLSKNIAEALTYKTGTAGEVLKMIIFLEESRWNRLSKILNKYNLNRDFIFNSFIKAAAYADQSSALLSENC